MATNFEQFALSNDKEGNVRLYKVKRSTKGNFPIAEECGPDITYQALHCVSEYMQALHNSDPADGVILQSEDGSRLVWYPPAKS